ncbi:MAG TPA: 2-phosphosulfolactate phosphatase [Burkholderiales bacterium]|nr:2-phosphosulfolactate phosphatase [Burkholderiales bacterium]
MELHHKLHVLTRKEELDAVRIPGKVVVVLDILFATTTMVTALAHGASDVLPVLDEAAARAAAARCEPGSFVLSGELNAQTLPGFAHPAPLALAAHGVQGRRVIYSTTNGTVAMTHCSGAAHVYCGSLLNVGALTSHILRAHPDDTILIVCAGSAGNFNLEDFVGAGAFVDRLASRLGPGADVSDAARAARAVFRSARLPQALHECRVGRLMASLGLAREVEFACRLDEYEVVPAMAGERLIAAPRA